MRAEFSAKVRAEAFARAAGHCEGCTAKLYTGQFDYDHDKPAEFGGAATLDNCRVLCKTCHRLKTSKSDIPAIAKSNRIRRRHMGIKKQRTIRGGRGFDGRAIHYD